MNPSNRAPVARPSGLARRRWARWLAATAIGFATCACQAQALRPLPPEFVATLQETDAAVADVAIAIRRFRSEDLSLRSPSPDRLDEAIGRIDKGIAQVRNQLDELRRRESLLLLLSIKGTLGAFASDLTGFSALLQSATVRSPAALDRLNSLLGELDRSAQATNAAFRKFDSGAYALLEKLDRQAAPQKP